LEEFAVDGNCRSQENVPSSTDLKKEVGRECAVIRETIYNALANNRRLSMAPTNRGHTSHRSTIGSLT
jgi:hypothetical protein